MIEQTAKTDFAFASSEEVSQLVPLIVELMSANSQRFDALAQLDPLVIRGKVRSVVPDELPCNGVGAAQALQQIVPLLVRNSVVPFNKRTVAHLHASPLAVAAAMDLVISSVNQSMDSWDQAPIASELEAVVSRYISRTVYGCTKSDTLITGGGTESNLVALLLAREMLGNDVQIICGDNCHHSIQRSAWLLGLTEPVVVNTVSGRLTSSLVKECLKKYQGPKLVVATAGTTDAGEIDPIEELALLCQETGSRLHVDGAYGGLLAFSDVNRHKISGIQLADTVSMDFHKFGWQPIASGTLSIKNSSDTKALSFVAHYLNATDDTDAGIPDLLGRSIKTSRRADAVRMLVSLLSLGKEGLARGIDACIKLSDEVEESLSTDERFEVLRPQNGISTLLFRPSNKLWVGRDKSVIVAKIRRSLMESGKALLGRALVSCDEESNALWWKITLLNPLLERKDIEKIFDDIETETKELANGQ